MKILRCRLTPWTSCQEPSRHLRDKGPEQTESDSLSPASLEESAASNRQDEDLVPAPTVIEDCSPQKKVSNFGLNLKKGSRSSISSVQCW